MKQIVEISGEGLEQFLGERILLFCANYIYNGKLVGVNETCIKLEDPAIVYETGSFSSKAYSTVEKLPAKFWYIERSLIESFGQGL